VIRDPGYRYRLRGSIPGAVRFSEKQGLELGPFRLARIIEELLGRKSRDSDLENQD
jgi:hypothetical protein